jgi:hypothetical protein
MDRSNLRVAIDTLLQFVSEHGSQYVLLTPQDVTLIQRAEEDVSIIMSCLSHWLTGRPVGLI